MKRWFRFAGFAGWSITARLVTLAVVPASLMLIAVNAWLYAVSANEANADIRERGRLIAASLSEGSRYGVISGNADSVERTVRNLMAADPSIASIEVFDRRHKAFVSARSPRGDRGALVFEASIGAGSLDVNLFDTLPPVMAASQAAASRDAGLAVGYVKVSMSPEPILEAKRDRLYIGSAMVLLAALSSAAVGLSLARRLREPLSAVMSALRGLRQGRFEVKLNEAAGGELGELQSAIVEMAKSLESTQQRLESQVASRTRELEQAVDTVRAADAEKRRLIARGNELVEEERRRISMEIHDDLNAVLVSARLQAAALAAEAAAGGRPDLQSSAARIAELIDAMYVRARNIVRKLRPEIIDLLGLGGAIEETVRHYDELDPACRFECRSDTPLPAMSEQAAIAAYRVVQEALSNVVKHSGASNCVVTVGRWAGGKGVRVTVQDNGRGFDTAAIVPSGLGLIGMRERVAALNGSLLVESVVGQGTRVTMILPLEM